MKDFEVKINPELIRWARESVSAKVEEVARKLDISEKEYESLENGEKLPTFSQLEKLSEFFSCPVAVFFLSEPPKEKYSSLVEKKARYYQKVVKELLEELGMSSTAKVMPVKLESNPVEVAKKEKELMGIEGMVIYEVLKEHIETKNIFVFEFDGESFSLKDRGPVVIVLNYKRPVREKIFTLLREYACVLLAREDREWCSKFAMEFMKDLVVVEDQKNEKRSKRFVSIVLSAREKELITTHDAIEYLGVKLKDLDKMQEIVIDSRL